MHVPQCVLPGFPEARVVQATGNRHPGSNFRPSSDMVLPGGCQWAAVIRRAAARGEEENQTKKTILLSRVSLRTRVSNGSSPCHAKTPNRYRSSPLTQASRHPCPKKMRTCRRASVGPAKENGCVVVFFQPIKRYCTASANYHIVFLLAHSH